MRTNVPPTGRIFVMFVIVDFHEHLFRKFKFRLTWTKCDCENAYVKDAAQILFMLDIYCYIQFIEDVARICSRTDAQLQKEI